MIDVHIPEPPQGVKDIAQVQKYLTDGLDAVVLETTKSEVYPGSLRYRIAGNNRDISIAVDRASKIGGVVD